MNYAKDKAKGDELRQVLLCLAGAWILRTDKRDSTEACPSATDGPPSRRSQKTSPSLLIAFWSMRFLRFNVISSTTFQQTTSGILRCYLVKFQRGLSSALTQDLGHLPLHRSVAVSTESRQLLGRYSSE